ncbi:hypothetical protein ACUXAV_000757 [Cupriavidus metallidurans]|jgi:hypothetical protein|uniref:ATP-binding protein n=1 Tax=Cupriavidus TaxID=106589 RepID=UPI00049381E0|nr:ATP-binding protein [Cupriavidus metallidurans]AVA36328.1 ATP-binding protein [Cupriavidus metallidurans]KWW37602.1 hypothetical protein AU374_01368 [Cupriavidus metallidurans]MDE4918658.1 ATP-binding protein [Cupriavidus metallidurans]UBM09928.1 ATP-binding protein [Cupriavidus metallidurans]
MNESESIFRRRQLAAELADELMGDSRTGMAWSGLFLSAPRRTGKSTFLREDLQPALERRGALVLVADLWKNNDVDPGDVIVDVVRQALAAHEGVVARAARAVGLDRFGFGGFSFSIDRVGLGKGVALSDALAELSDKVQRPIALIIDEAQQCMATRRGNNAMFALKAARDELNFAHHGLRIIATGSDHVKLRMLLGSREAFFCATERIFPVLGRDYIDWFRSRHGFSDVLNADVMTHLFARAAYRPELFESAAVAVGRDGLVGDDAAAVLERRIDEQMRAVHAPAMRTLEELPPLDDAIIRVMATSKQMFAGFSASTMQTYRRVMNALSGEPSSRLDYAEVERALERLVVLRLVWRSALGLHVLEDPTLAEAMRRAGLLDVVRRVSGRKLTLVSGAEHDLSVA